LFFENEVREDQLEHNVIYFSAQARGRMHRISMSYFQFLKFEVDANQIIQHGPRLLIKKT